MKLVQKALKVLCILTLWKKVYLGLKSFPQAEAFCDECLKKNGLFNLSALMTTEYPFCWKVVGKNSCYHLGNKMIFNCRVVGQIIYRSFINREFTLTSCVCHSDAQFNKTHVCQRGDWEEVHITNFGGFVNDTPKMHFTDLYGHSLCCAEWCVSASWCQYYFFLYSGIQTP